MWARHMELALGLWLLTSPFVFRHASDRSGLWAHDLLIGAAVVSLALATHWRPLRRAHLVLLPLAVWLMGAGWWAARGAGIHPPAAYQNWILVGLLLAMFAIVPSRASRPPKPWRRRRSSPREAFHS